jgi:hypothetical protein
MSTATKLRTITQNGVDLMRGRQARGMLQPMTLFPNAAHGPVDIWWMGDSLLGGTNAAGADNMVVQRVMHALREAYPIDGVIGGWNWIPADNTAIGPQLTGTTASVACGPGNSGKQLTSSGATLTWTNLFCTSFDLRFRFSAGDSVSITIDGGSPVTVTAGSTNTNQLWNSGALTLGNHTVVITQLAGTPTLIGGFIYNGDETIGIRSINAARPGAKIADLLTAGGGSEDWLNFVGPGNMTQPALAVIEFTANDATNYNAATFQTYLTSLVGKLQGAGVKSFLFLGAHRRVDSPSVTIDPWDNYVDVMRNVCAATPFSAALILDDAIDITTPFAWFSTTQNTSPDTTGGDYHGYGTTGQDVWARLICEFLIPHPTPAGHQRLKMFRSPLRVFGVGNVVTALFRAAPGQNADILQVQSVSGGTVYFNVDWQGATHATNLIVTNSSGQISNEGGNPGTGVADYRLTRVGALRWLLRMDNTAESGSNVGSDLTINAYDDTATLLGTAVKFTRRTLAAVFSATVTAPAMTLLSATQGGIVDLLFQKTVSGAAKNRIDMRLNGSTESGSNAGSDLQVTTYADDGTTNLGVPFFIQRKAAATVIRVFPVNTTGLTSAQIDAALPAGLTAADDMFITDVTNNLMLVRQGGKWWKTAALTQIS